MTRPHPVVGVVTVFSYRVWRGSNEPYIAVNFIDEGKELVAAVKRAYLCPVVVALCGFEGYCGSLSVEGFGACCFCHFGSHFCQHAGSDVFDPYEEGHAESGVGEFLVAGHSPETVGKIIVLNGAVILYLTVSAVVVCQEKAFGRDDLAGASAAEDNDCVFHAGFIDAVDVFGCQLQSHFGHSADIQLLEKRKEPHTLISSGGRAGEGQEDDHKCK